KPPTWPPRKPPPWPPPRPRWAKLGDAMLTTTARLRAATRETRHVEPIIPPICLLLPAVGRFEVSDSVPRWIRGGEWMDEYAKTKPSVSLEAVAVSAQRSLCPRFGETALHRPTRPAGPSGL